MRRTPGSRQVIGGNAVYRPSMFNYGVGLLIDDHSAAFVQQ